MQKTKQPRARTAPEIDATPLARELWAGIAGHFDSITQVVCEFVDNSISNFEGSRSQARSIQIRVEETEDGGVEFSIEDAGSGIARFEPVLRLGDQSVRQTPLNEHGFGLKHALASANPTNDNWTIFTRTRNDFEEGRYRKLSAPYDFHMNPETVVTAESPWPGVFNGSGTIIRFTCSSTLFHTVQRGIKGLAGFTKCLNYLAEELGYVYSGIIEKGKATIAVTSSEERYSKQVEAVRPIWAGYYDPPAGSHRHDLGGGQLLIEYVFGQMKDGPYVKHYKENQSTSGVEIRINGRMMMSNVFKDIWQLENHPSYNHFLAIINLVSQSREALPKTRTSKNGIRSGDPKLDKLFEWIRSTHPNPHKDLANAQSERELVSDLADLKTKHIRNPAKHVQVEFRVFTSLNAPVNADLYVFDGHEIVIYEAKKDTADIQNLYQLVMYWDGLVEDGKSPSEGILIAKDFSPGVDTLLAVFNRTRDRAGNQYHLSKRTWREEGIEYG